MADDRSDWVWLAFPGGGPAAQFPPASAPMWRVKGWVDSEPPPEPNPLKDPEPGLEPEPEAPTAALMPVEPEPQGPDDVDHTSEPEE